jgi:predicted AAA+ superfamily ATPase
VYYWNESNAEVDFIIQYQQKYIALEVKIGTDKITGLAEFQKKFKPHKVYQLSESGLSWQKFITIDPKSLF